MPPPQRRTRPPRPRPPAEDDRPDGHEEGLVDLSLGEQVIAVRPDVPDPLLDLHPGGQRRIHRRDVLDRGLRCPCRSLFGARFILAGAGLGVSSSTKPMGRATRQVPDTPRE